MADEELSRSSALSRLSAANARRSEPRPLRSLCAHGSLRAVLFCTARDRRFGGRLVSRSSKWADDVPASSRQLQVRAPRLEVLRTEHRTPVSRRYHAAEDRHRRTPAV